MEVFIISKSSKIAAIFKYTGYVIKSSENESIMCVAFRTLLAILKRLILAICAIRLNVN